MNTAWTTASEEMYKATQQHGLVQMASSSNAQQPNEGQKKCTRSNDNVTDAEFEEVK